MEIIQVLKQFGLSDKEVTVYLTLLKTGPNSVRKLADQSGINRGTTYDILKALKDMGLVSYYHKATKQFFVAEDPGRLIDALEQKSHDLLEVKKQLALLVPELKSLQEKSGGRPVVKYYEASQGVKSILTDVLETMNQSAVKEYYVFSSSAIRQFLYKALPSFTDQRVKKGVKVKSIAIGHSGSPAELAEIKSLPGKDAAPTYTLIYESKVAMISVNLENQPVGVIIEDRAIYQTQKQLFDFIWQTL